MICCRAAGRGCRVPACPIMSPKTALTADFCMHLHGQQTGQVDLGDGLGPLSLSQAASAVFGQLRLLAGFHQMPQPHTALLCVLQHGSLCAGQRFHS